MRSYTTGLVIVLWVVCGQGVSISDSHKSRELQQISDSNLNDRSCAVVVNAHVDGIPVDDKIRFTEDLSECCSLCEEEPTCNVFTYCPLKAGCQDSGLNLGVLDYQTCTLKFQHQVGDGKKPSYLLDALSEFQSGYILNKTRPEDFQNFVRAMISYGGQALEEYSQDEVDYQECTDKQPARFETCQEKKQFGKCNDRWIILRDYCAYTCGRCTNMQPTQKCTTLDNFNAKGSLVDTQLRYARDIGECCRMCADNENCNVFVFCGKSKGCRNEAAGDIVTNYARCDLKYQEAVATGEEPESWFSGPTTDFTSGYIPKTNTLSKSYTVIDEEEETVGTTINAPTPTPAPTPNPTPTPSTSQFTSFVPVPTRQQGIFNPSFLGSRSGQCLVQFSYDEQQNSLLERLTGVRNLGECCKKCSQNVNCNFFSFCNEEKGCVVEGKAKDYQICELKYDQLMAFFGVPQNWKSGSDDKIFQGVVSGYVVARAT